MKIYVLAENTTTDSALTAEHGLSFLIETQQHKILFDAGQTSAFLDNAGKMGLDLKEADMAVLSHGHYDHGGGLEYFLELNDRAQVYVSRYAFAPYFNGQDKYIGLDKSLEENERFIVTGDELQIDSELSLYSCNQMKKTAATDSFGLNTMVQGKFVPDRFLHEQYLLIRQGEQKILISGCSHKGILNIVNWFQPDILVGGFHFMKLDPENPDHKKQLEYAGKELLQYPVRYFTGHCTGTRQYQCLKEIMGSRLEYFSTGQTLIL